MFGASFDVAGNNYCSLSFCTSSNGYCSACQSGVPKGVDGNSNCDSSKIAMKFTFLD